MPWTSASSSSWVVAFGEAIRPPRVACSAAMSCGGTRSYIVWCLHHLGGRDALLGRSVPPFLCLGSVRGSHAGEVVQAVGDVGSTDRAVFFEQPVQDWFGGCVAHDAGQLFPVFLAGGVGLGGLVGLCTALRCTLSADLTESVVKVPVVGHVADEPTWRGPHVGSDALPQSLGVVIGGVGEVLDQVHRPHPRFFLRRRRLLFFLPRALWGR